VSIKQIQQAFRCDVEPRLKIVALALADHADDHGYRVRPGLELLTEKTGLGRRQVQRMLASLREQGALVPLRYAAGGRGCATEYRLHLERLPQLPSRGDETVSPATPLEPGNDVMGDVVSPENGDAHDTVSQENSDADVADLGVQKPETVSPGTQRVSPVTPQPSRTVRSERESTLALAGGSAGEAGEESRAATVTVPPGLQRIADEFAADGIHHCRAIPKAYSEACDRYGDRVSLGQWRKWLQCHDYFGCSCGMRPEGHGPRKGPVPLKAVPAPKIEAVPTHGDDGHLLTGPERVAWIQARNRRLNAEARAARAAGGAS